MGYNQPKKAGGVTTTQIINSTYTYAEDAEASDAYAISLSTAPSAYVAGQTFRFLANTANTGGATLNVNSLGAKNILKQNDKALQTGDIEAGSIVTVVYDGTSFQMVSADANLNLDEIDAGTTNVHFTATDESKLDGIEASADVTDGVNVGSAMHGATSKATPVDADTVAFTDTEASNVIKKLSWTNIKAFLKTYFDTLYGDMNDLVDDTTPQFGGEVDMNDKNINLSAVPASDHSGVGLITDAHNAGATISAMQLVYLASDGEWALVDADAESTTAGLLGIALEAGTDGNPLKVLLQGYARDDTWNWTTVGDTLYADTTAGGVTATAPSGTTDVVRVVGHAVSADVILFNPSQDYAVLA